ncbi:glycoside hydrolase family 55 protein [Acidomyces richmondensis BFW]|nr:glycoside hydrolase family 55 protein [Acidomyces richmondensis BFW]
MDGGRCTTDCNSSTTSQAIVYFPYGTYLVHAPLTMPYYTQVIGDVNNLPTIQATSNFSGMAVLDADPYGPGGVNWYINQNNFFRQVRNLIIDLTQIEGTTGSGIHWQVAQATSLQNILFKMSQDSDTEQQGIFMDNGSGGYMEDLTFEGGKYGAFLGSQQFTSRNMTFNNCQTGIYMNWNWGWTLEGITVNGGVVGIDMSNSPDNQTVGSMVVSDSTFTGSQYGIRTAFSMDNDVPATGGTLVVDNVDMSGVTTGAIVSTDNSVIVAPGMISNYVAGNVYDQSSTQSRVEGSSTTAPTKSSNLLASNGDLYSRSKPQYGNYSADDFLSSMGFGCVGNATFDDTENVQNFLNAAASAGKIAYFNHGTYLVTDTIVVPANLKIVGECWSTILASGFNDASNPKVVWQVGNEGESGAVEMSDMLFEIQGPNPGAIMIQWNLQSEQGASGMWDTHVRIGGSYGTDLLLANCPTSQGANPSTDCFGAFMMFHASANSSGVYLANTWFWTADHDMENALNTQISIYNGRGMLIQSTGPVWLWGTSSEHSIMYNYQFDGVQSLFSGLMQSETPYFQPVPDAPSPLIGFNSAYDDPTFSMCSNSSDSSSVPCKDSWGLRVLNSKDVLIYSTGFYSFFNDYTQACVSSEDCQQNIIHIDNSQVSMYAVTTKASVNMIVDSAYSQTPVLASDNMDVYGSTVAYYNTGS